MSGAAHTPGPWQIHDYKLRSALGHNPMRDIGTNGRAVCSVIGAFEADDVSGEHMANALLIAAAPDLLAALETLTKRIAYVLDSDRENTSPMSRESRNVAQSWLRAQLSGEIQAALFAIAKAEG